MGEVIRKTDKRLHAQVETYAATAVQPFSPEQEFIFKNIDTLTGVADLSNVDGADFPVEIKQFILANKESYQAWLSQNGRSEERKLEIRKREENDNRYVHFKPFIDEILRRKRGGQIERIPGFIDTGAEGDVFKIVLGGEQYIVKIFQSRMDKQAVPPKSRRSVSHLTAQGMRRAAGIPYVCQLDCYSARDGVQVMEYMPGVPIGELGQMPNYNYSCIKQLVDTIARLRERRLHVDYARGNFLYDRENQVINVIDYKPDELYALMAQARGRKKSGAGESHKIDEQHELALAMYNLAFSLTGLAKPSAKGAVQEIIVMDFLLRAIRENYPESFAVLAREPKAQQELLRRINHFLELAGSDPGIMDTYRPLLRIMWQSMNLAAFQNA